MYNASLTKTKVQQLLVFSMILVLGLTTVSCGFPQNTTPSANSPQSQQSNPQTAQPAGNAQTGQVRLTDGQYPVQQATYDDGTGEYSLFLLNTKPGESSTLRTTNLPMARLTEAEVKGGQGSYLKVEQGQPALHLTEDFKIEYVHNVAETVANPQTGQSETVVVRQESSFWTPFAGALAGQALGSLLFTPHYYLPPVYQPGVILTGNGGYGRTYGQAVQRYQTRYQAPPAEVRNRQTLRTSGRLRSPGYGQPTIRRNQPAGGDRSTGSGYGSTNLQRSNRSTPNRTLQSPSRRRSFGSGTRSFGGRRRR